jgi:sortase A
MARRDVFRDRHGGRGGRQSFLTLVAAGLIAVSIWQLGGAALIQGKAWLAPILIEKAWAESIETGKPVKPWPWADTWPVVRLNVPALGISRYVLAGANGGSLPFGPGHLEGTALPGEPGTIVIAAHRDTHFGFLPELHPGSVIELQGMDGFRQRFSVTGQEIVDARRHGILPQSIVTELILVTCQPTSEFIYRGPFRLVVTARPVARQEPAVDPAANDDEPRYLAGN